MVMKMKIIVPIMAKNKTEAAVQAAALRENPGADWVELRLDPLPAADWRDTLTAVRAAVGDKPLIVTIRTSREGGLADISVPDYAAACRMLLEAGGVDYLDVEFSAGEAVLPLTEAAHRAGAKVIYSCHHFEGTPATGEMVDTLLAMEGGDIAKLAVMPHCAADAARLLEATAAAAAQMPHTPLITMSMGALGAVTRVCGGAFGSMATFGTAGRASAPGQPDAALLRRALHLLEEI